MTLFVTPMVRCMAKRASLGASVGVKDRFSANGKRAAGPNTWQCASHAPSGRVSVGRLGWSAKAFGVRCTRERSVRIGRDALEGYLAHLVWRLVLDLLRGDPIGDGCHCLAIAGRLVEVRVLRNRRARLQPLLHPVEGRLRDCRSQFPKSSCISEDACPGTDCRR